MRFGKALPYLLLLAISLATSLAASGQSQPPSSAVPDPYRQKFVRYVDNRTLKEAMLNSVGLTGQDVGHSFALIAGVSQYPNMPEVYKTLPPAAADIEELKNYLINQEMFDEVVVLKDGDMTPENLRYFMEVYFPDRLQKFPKSRFLFAYSGHGISLGSASDPRGFILTSAAKSFTDTEHAINMATLRLYVDELAEAGYQTLALINACHSGVFLRKSFGGGGSLIPREPGAHAITAGGSDQRTWSDPRMGRGSIFFESLLAGLGGEADFFPVTPDGKHGDGIITVEELATYLRQEVSLNTGQSQTPILTDLKPGGSNGGFFFLNRQRMVAHGFVPNWDPKRNTAFGAEAEVTLKSAKDLFQAGNYAAAFTLFQQTGDQGNGEAARYVGFMYSRGLGTKQDMAESVFWSRKAAEDGDSYGMVNLGVDYEHGYGGLEADDSAAVLWYNKGAEAGVANGMTNLGVMYQYGRGGLAADPAHAVALYRKGADGGDARAMANLGTMYEYGYGGLKADQAHAVSLYRKSADAGDERAMSSLGLMYELGRGVPVDAVQAVSWYRKSADLGDARGMDFLGEMYEAGHGGLPLDVAQAVYWYRKSADGGNTRGTTDLGVMYEQGRGGLPEDNAQAVSLYRKAADMGDSRAMAFLGSAYETGQGGLRADNVQAVYWYRKAAEAGSGRGMTDIGVMYEHGLGGLKADATEALSWYRKAADEGDARGMANLGLTYEYGRGGLPADATQAVFWYRRASDAGDARGNVLLGEMYEAAKGGLPADPAQAVLLYRKSAEDGDGLGMLKLANSYENGIGGLKKDKDQAAIWYGKAADLGSEEAKRGLERVRKQ